jgi:hypothetical protein
MVDGSTPLTERQRRAGVMRQFELQMPKYPLSIRERLTNYRYRMYDEARDVELLATVLVTSFDFYEHRLNLVRRGIDLVVCQKHNAALPVWCLELDSAHLHKPGTAPNVRRPVAPDHRHRRTQDEQRVLISEIILGVDSAMVELNSMPLRTRQRYLKLREQYLSPKVGRPWAS